MSLPSPRPGSNLATKTKMSTFFTRLPRELREKVYKDLLLDEKNGVEPQGTFPPGKKVRRIYPEILRACKQAYAEAIVVLYEQNLFRFEYRGPCHFEYSYSYPYTENGEKRLFPKWVTLSANFSRITKVSFNFFVFVILPCTNRSDIRHNHLLLVPRSLSVVLIVAIKTRLLLGKA